MNRQMTSKTWSASSPWPAYNVNGGATYTYSSTQNNGQITQVVDSVSGETISYQYDALKRLVSAASTPSSGSTPAAWTQTYQYDGFGNLTAKVLNGTTTSIPVTASTNRLSSASYDANGNMTSGVGASFAFDEANRIVYAAETSGGSEQYGYAPDNKRIYRVKTDGSEEWAFYGARGDKLGVYTLIWSTTGPTFSGTGNVWFGGSW